MKDTRNLDQQRELLRKKRKLLGRGLSFAEKILFLHEGPDTAGKVLTRGKDSMRLYPDRVAMQDATAQMAMLQFMQSGKRSTVVAATIHCDHLIRARRGAEEDLDQALHENEEVYDFLSSAAQKYGLGFWKPGSGIIHQVVFENYAVPGMLLIGTDSHTPNAGGLGVIAVGVGGADAAEVMAGLAWETTAPYLVGVRLSGSLQGWASSKDVILEMLKRLTVKGGTGKIFEYFGEGARTLSATQKATICNMGAEMGATASVFVYDAAMDAYLHNVGRGADADQARERADLLGQDDICVSSPETVYDEILEIDLATIKPAHAGPFSPDAITAVADFASLVENQSLPRNVSAVLVGSCTNSSYADLAAAANVLDQGINRGLKARVPLFLSPGSRRIYETIQRNGILDALLSAGATLLSPSCGPCIGQWDREDVQKGIPNCLFTTFNRNFRGRNDANPETRAFLTSPVMAAVLALAGEVDFNPETDSLIDCNGETFVLTPPHPPALPQQGLVLTTEGFVPPSPNGAAAEVTVDPLSERIQLLEPFEQWDGNDFVRLPVLVKTKGKTTTDHISPGGKWLDYRGHLANISRNLLEGAVNAFTGETGQGTNVLTGQKGVKFAELACSYRTHAGGSVIIGDENYGEGSSREHAAMSPRFLGVKAVIARSFARIHEANLKKQGILPLTFADPQDYLKIDENDRISLGGLNELSPERLLKAVVQKMDGSTVGIALNHTLSERHIAWFKAGSALNLARGE